MRSLSGLVRVRVVQGACLALGVSVLLSAAGCDSKAGAGGEASASPSGQPANQLSPEMAAKVLAKVGDREITLGEFAATLERMDQFERLRYQSPERRRQLLDEMIQVELLAQEAERRGLDKQPETEERIRIILRNEVLRRLRSEIPGPDTISEAEVRKYYDEHRDEFSEPERRRVAVIVLSDRTRADQALAKAKQASAMLWGELVEQYSLEKPPAPSPTMPRELAGDLGIVSAPGVERGANLRVPEPVRAAVFKLEKIGDVAPELVEAEGKFYVVRMIGKTDARDRPFAEAERSIRVSLVQEKIRLRENELEQQLRQKYPVKIDDAALARVRLPHEIAAPGQSAAPSSAEVPPAPAPSSAP